VLTEYLRHDTTARSPCFAANIVLVAMRDIAEGGELNTGYARPGGYEARWEAAVGQHPAGGAIGGRDWHRLELQHTYGSYFPAPSCAGTPSSPRSTLSPADGFTYPSGFP
jgi:hypothetical protein